MIIKMNSVKNIENQIVFETRGNSKVQLFLFHFILNPNYQIDFQSNSDLAFTLGRVYI